MNLHRQKLPMAKADLRRPAMNDSMIAAFQLSLRFQDAAGMLIKLCQRVQDVEVQRLLLYEIAWLYEQAAIVAPTRDARIALYLLGHEFLYEARGGRVTLQ